MNGKSLIIDKIVKGYIDAMLWSSLGELHPQTGEELDSLEEFETSSQLKGESWHVCLNFYDKNELDCHFYYYRRQPDIGWCAWECLGKDLWLTSAGHGAGFWDRGLGELGDRLTKACEQYRKDVYLGDDGLVYLS